MNQKYIINNDSKKENFFNIRTISTPIRNKNNKNPGYKIANISLIYVDNFSINKNNFFNRMDSLDIKNITIVIISDSYDNDFKTEIFTQREEFNIYCISLMFVKSDIFFSYAGFHFFFSTPNDYIFVFENII